MGSPSILAENELLLETRGGLRRALTWFRPSRFTHVYETGTLSANCAAPFNWEFHVFGFPFPVSNTRLGYFLAECNLHDGNVCEFVVLWHVGRGGTADYL